MAVKLNKNEIKQRFIKLRNFEMLHPKARKKVKLLEEQVKLLKEENTALKALVAEQKLLIEKLRLRIEELEQMVFGRKKKNNQSNDDLPQSNQGDRPPKKPRDPQSYRRPLPNDEDITETREYPIDICPDCQTPLTNYKTITQYKEDIKLLNNALKQIEKQKVQTGWCPHCHKRKAPLPIQPQAVYFGENIKQFVSWAN
ncbi:MAG: hypothetical protein Q8N55_04075, partial [bacterium]|nr:hypothetical protein [bacterium]